MAKILEEVVAGIVDHPSDVSVERQELEHGISLTVTVNADDLPKLLGEDGRTERSLRAMIAAFGNRFSKKYSLHFRSKPS